MLLLSVIASAFTEIKNSISALHVIDRIPDTTLNCKSKCETDTFCQGFSFASGICTTYFYLPQFTREHDKTNSIFIKNEQYRGVFSNGYLVMRRTSFENCSENICTVNATDKLVKSNRSSRIKTDLDLKFENLPLVSTAAQYWKNVTNNSTIHDCLSKCDTYGSCLAVQYTFNSTSCAMLDVWPGEFVEIDSSEVLADSMDTEFFLKIDYKDFGFQISNGVPILNDTSIRNLTINDCTDTCAGKPACSGIYYANNNCHLLSKGYSINGSAVSIGLHLIKDNQPEAAIVKKLSSSTAITPCISH
eukprot:NODE_619_length_5923_cov_0.480769.p2 type:complete len:303 gc:universal NODE_619_length_5923_cov_0.480769:757-1665(+)